MARSTTLALVPQFFGSLLFDRNGARYWPFDHETTAILRRMIDAGASAVVAEASEVTREPVVGLVEHALTQGWLTPDGRLAADALDVAPPEGHLTGPLVVHLEVSDRCDLCCAHCFASGFPRGEPAMPWAVLEALLDDLAALGSFRLGLTGGEPFLRPELFDVIDAALERGLCPCVTTNGQHLTPGVVDRLERCGGRLWLNVSLDGADAETNDAVRGRGAFERALAGMSRLAGRVPFSVAFTVTSSTAPRIEGCVELARRVGADAAVFRPLYPVGRGATAADLEVSFSEYAGACARLEGVADRLSGASFHVVDAFGPGTREAARARVAPAATCGAATVAASVSLAGEVSPCSFLGSRAVAGTLRERSFREIWDDAPLFKALRGGGGAFRGGCRARALWAGGTMWSADPWERQWEEVRDGHPV